MSPSLITAALAQTDLFRELPESVMNRIVSSATVRELRPGEVLLSPQIENQHVYVLLSGQLGVHLGKLDSPSIRALEAGTSVGEMSIIESTLPSAYVVASQPSSVFPIHSELIHTLVSETSPFGRNLVRLLIHLMKAKPHVGIFEGNLSPDFATLKADWALVAEAASARGMALADACQLLSLGDLSRLQ